MLRQILEESLRQSKQEEQDRHAAAETEFREQLRAAHAQNRLDQQKREEELEAQAEAELQEQIRLAMEMSAKAEEERVQKSKERAEQLLKMDRDFGSRNQNPNPNPGVVRSNTTIGSTSSPLVADVRFPVRSNTVQSPPVGRDTRAPAVSSTRNEPVVDRQRPVSTPTLLARASQPDPQRPSPIRSPYVSSTRVTSGTVRQIRSQSSTVSSTRNEHDQSRGRLCQVYVFRRSHNTISPDVVPPPYTELRSSSQSSDGGRTQHPGPSPPRPSPPRERGPDNGNLPVSGRPELSRRSTSSSAASRNWPIRPAQRERTMLDENNGSQRPSNHPSDCSPSFTGSMALPSSQLRRSSTLRETIEMNQEMIAGRQSLEPW